MIKRFVEIALLTLALSVATSCHRPIPRASVPAVSPSLAAIDTMMWKQPDSAFRMLLDLAASPEADSLDVFNGHYCQLLISELLYKNYYGQSNRNELLKAVGYFDSLMMDNGQGAGKRSTEEQERNVFLDARAHYINGVGYYERDSLVEACEAYLKVLEVMEEHFDDRDLMGHRAAFMFYTNNRLLSLFSSQYMMDPAIACGEKALEYCQKEPSLSKEIPNTYFFIGKQYDMKGDRDSARIYYELAIEGLADINNLVYRDVITTKVLCDFQDGLNAEDPLATIRQMLSYAISEKERLSRFLALGGIYTIEHSFDSAVYYLEPVYENQDYVALQITAAEYLLINYENLGNEEKKDECMRFIVDHKKPEGEDKAMVSKLEAMYKNYLDKKQLKEAEAERRKSIGKTVRIVLPICVLVVLAILVMAKRKSKKLLTSERMAHQKEREVIKQSLQQSNENVSALQEELGRKRTVAAEHYAAFLEEPVCIKINGLVRDLHITTRKPYSDYHIRLDDDTIAQLSEVVTAHYSELKPALHCLYPGIGHEDLLLCYLYLLGLSNKQIAVLRQRDYSTIRKQAKELMGKLGINETLREYVLRVGGIEGVAEE